MFSPYDERNKSGALNNNEPVDLDQVDVVQTADEVAVRKTEYPHYLYDSRPAAALEAVSPDRVDRNAFFLDPNNSSIPYGSRDGIMFINGGSVASAGVVGLVLAFIFVMFSTSFTSSSRYYNSVTDNSGIVLLGMVVFAGLIGYAIWQYLRDQKLLKEGIILEGHVMEVNTSWSKSNLTLHINYHFRSPDGDLVYGRRSRTRNDLRETGFWRNRVAHDQLPQSGTPVYVLYRNDGHYTLL